MPDQELQALYAEARRRGIFKEDAELADLTQQAVKRGILRDLSGGSQYDAPAPAPALTLNAPLDLSPSLGSGSSLSSFAALSPSPVAPVPTVPMRPRVVKPRRAASVQSVDDVPLSEKILTSGRQGALARLTQANQKAGKGAPVKVRPGVNPVPVRRDAAGFTPAQRAYMNAHGYDDRRASVPTAASVPIAAPAKPFAQMSVLDKAESLLGTANEVFTGRRDGVTGKANAKRLTYPSAESPDAAKMVNLTRNLVQGGIKGGLGRAADADGSTNELLNAGATLRQILDPRFAGENLSNALAAAGGDSGPQMVDPYMPEGLRTDTAAGRLLQMALGAATAPELMRSGARAVPGMAREAGRVGLVARTRANAARGRVPILDADGSLLGYAKGGAAKPKAKPAAATTTSKPAASASIPPSPPSASPVPRAISAAAKAATKPVRATVPAALPREPEMLTLPAPVPTAPRRAIPVPPPGARDVISPEPIAVEPAPQPAPVMPEAAPRADVEPSPYAMDVDAPVSNLTDTEAAYKERVSGALREEWVPRGQITVRSDVMQFRRKTSTDFPSWNEKEAAKNPVAAWVDVKGELGVPGATVLVNGHHRLQNGDKFKVPMHRVRYIEADNAATAREIGALENLLDSPRNDALDVGNFLRQSESARASGDAAKFLRENGVNTGSDVVKSGLALSRLPGESFDLLLNQADKTPGLLRAAGAIADAIPDTKKAHARLARAMEQVSQGGKIVTPEQIAEEARIEKARADADAMGGGFDFGDDASIETRARVLAGVKKHFGELTQAGRNIGKSSVGKYFGVTAEQAKKGDVAAQVGEIIDRTANHSTPLGARVSETVNRIVSGAAEAGEIQSLVRELESGAIIKDSLAGGGAVRAGKPVVTSRSGELAAGTAARAEVPAASQSAGGSGSGASAAPAPAGVVSAKRGRPKSTVVKPTNPRTFAVWSDAGVLDADVPRYVEVNGKPVTIPGHEKLDLFIHEDTMVSKRQPQIVEGRTGRIIATAETAAEAAAKAKAVLDKAGDKLDGLLDGFAAERGVSPRYKAKGSEVQAANKNPVVVGRAGMVSTRIPIEPLPLERGQGGVVDLVPKDVMHRELEVGIGRKVTMRRNMPVRNAAGAYNPGSGDVSVASANDFDTIAHEVGHAISDRAGMARKADAATLAAMDAELTANFAPFGSAPPSSLTPAEAAAYVREEGIAEWVRAYIMHPQEAGAQAPATLAQYKKVVAPKVQATVATYSERVRRYYSRDAEAPELRRKASTKYAPAAKPGAKERLAKMVQGVKSARSPLDPETGFYRTSPASAAATRVFNDHAPLVQAVEEALKRSGTAYEPARFKAEGGINPGDDPALLARATRYFNVKAQAMLHQGLVDLEGKSLTPPLLYLYEPMAESYPKGGPDFDADVAGAFAHALNKAVVAEGESIALELDARAAAAADKVRDQAQGRIDRRVKASKKLVQIERETAVARARIEEQTRATIRTATAEIRARYRTRASTETPLVARESGRDVARTEREIKAEIARMETRAWEKAASQIALAEVRIRGRGAVNVARTEGKAQVRVQRAVRLRKTAKGKARAVRRGQQAVDLATRKNLVAGDSQVARARGANNARTKALVSKKTSDLSGKGAVKVQGVKDAGVARLAKLATRQQGRATAGENRIGVIAVGADARRVTRLGKAETARQARASAEVARIARSEWSKAQKRLQKVMERRARMQERAFAGVSGQSGGLDDVADARAAMTQLQASEPARFARYEEAARRLEEDFARPVLAMLRDAGRISVEQHDRIVASKSYYAPMERFLQDAPQMQTGGVGGQQMARARSVVRGRAGSTEMTVDPSVTIIKNLMQAAKEAQVNQVKQAMFRLFVPTRGMGAAPTAAEPTLFADIAREVFPKQRMGRDDLNSLPVNTITVYLDGQARYLELPDPGSAGVSLFGMMQDLGRLPNIPPLYVAKQFRNTIHLLATKNVVFLWRNLVRDPLDRMLTSRTGATPFSPQDFTDYFAKPTDAEMKAMEFFGLSQNKAEWLAKGGDWEAAQGAILREAGLRRAGRPLWMDKVEGFVNIAGDKSEQFTRLAEYRSAYRLGKKKGLSDADAQKFAVDEMRRLLDFAEAGQYSRWLNGNLYPFFSSRLYGAKRMAEIYSGKKGKAYAGRAWKRLLGYSALSSLMAYLWNAAQGQEAVDEVQRFPTYVRNLFHMIRVPGTHRFVGIPKAFDVGFFSTIVEGGLYHAHNVRNGMDAKKSRELAFAGIAESALHAVVPLDETNLVAGPFSAVQQARQNKNFLTGGEIVPGYEDNLNLSQRRDTDEATRLGQWTQKMSQQWFGPDGGVDARKVDFFVANQFPYYGRLLTQVSDVGRVDRPQAGKTALERLTGLTREAPGGDSRQVQTAMRKASAAGLAASDKVMKVFRSKRRTWQGADGDVARAKAAVDLIAFAESDLVAVKTEMAREKGLLTNDIVNGVLAGLKDAPIAVRKAVEEKVRADIGRAYRKARR